MVECCNKCINEKDEKKNDTIAKLLKPNNKLSVETSTVKQLFFTQHTMPRNCVDFIDA